MFDIVSFILGRKQGEKTVVIDSDNYDFSDDNNDGNVVIEEGDNNG